MVRFRVLGPLEVHDGERVVELPPGKQRLLLAALLLRAGEIVATDTLIEQLWGERPPRTAKGALVNNVSLLRKALGPDVLVTRAPGYALDVSSEQTDVGQFEQLTTEARVTESVAERAEKLRGALALWRGQPFADLAFESFAQLEISRLEDLRLAARQDLIDAELERGNHADLLPELETLIQQHPFDERLRGQQMLALFRAGRQADALEAYQTTRRLLDDELGLEPGAELRELEQAILRQDPALAAPKAEAGVLPSRRKVTVLFADLVESTELADRLDPEALQAVLSGYFIVMRDAIERHGGTVEKFIGDAVMAVFGVPRSHEDDALRAVRAAVDSHNALRILEGGLQARIGVNTGEVVTGRGELLVTGAAVNLAKRLEQAAPSGEILISASTLRLIRHAITVEPAGTLGAGNEIPVPCFRLIEIAAGAPALERRLEAPLVGRQKELAQLRHVFNRVCEQRHCQVVTVLGDAGIGKTRLILELESKLAGGVTVLTGNCVPYGEGATYLPLAEMLGQAGADFAAITADVSSTGEIALRVRERFEQLAAKQPLVLVFEDVHWAEPTLLDLIDYLGERAQAPILCLCSARPELQEVHPQDLEAIVELKPLPDEQLQILVASLEHDLDSEQLTRIVETSEGNPLFAEQLVAYALEGDLRGLATVPPSIEALLASRIDLLTAIQRATLQRAAIIGREFSRQALEALGSVEALPRLRDAGFVHASGDELRFHHVLVRDVAYTGIPKSERAGLHEHYADWLEGQPTRFDEIIGYHLEQAYLYLTELGERNGRAHELAIRASTRLESAGRHASYRHDIGATVNLLERALKLRDSDDPAVSLRIDLARALTVAHRHDVAVAITTEGAELAKASGDMAGALRAQLVATRTEWWYEIAVTSGDLLALLEVARPALEQAGDDQGLSEVYRMIAELESNQCRKAAALDALALAALHARRAGDVRSLREMVWVAGYFQIYGPTPVEQGLDWLDTQREDDSYPGTIETLRAQLLMMLGHFDEAAAMIEEGRALAADVGMDTGAGEWSYHLEVLRGDHIAAERAVQRSCERLARHGSTGVLSTFKGLLADALYVLGRDAEAEEAIAEGEALSMSDDVTNQILFRRVRAKLSARKGEQERAEQLAREAVAIGEQTDVLNQRGDAHSDLAEVLMMAGRAEDAAAELENALAVYEQKGNLVMAERTRERLAELSPQQPLEPLADP